MQCHRYSKVICLILFSWCFTITTSTVSTPDFITPCQSMSQECLKDSIQSALPGFIVGVPALGINSLDPFFVDKVDLTLPGGLEIEFRRSYAKGFKKCIVEFARMVEDNLEVQFRCNLTVIGKYKSSGRFLMFPINGDGDSMIKCKNIKINFLFELGSKLELDGLEYLDIKNFQSHHSYDGQVIYRMTNLFKGSPEMSNLVLDFMNKNWKMVAEEFGKPIMDYGVTAILRNIKLLFKMVPLRQLIRAPNL